MDIAVCLTIISFSWELLPKIWFTGNETLRRLSQVTVGLSGSYIYLCQLVSSWKVICREDTSYETVGDHAREAGILWSSFHWHRWQMLRRQPRISFTPHAFTKNALVLCMLQRLILGLIQRKTEITLVNFIRWNQRTSRRNRLMRRSSTCRVCKKTRYIWLSKKDRPKKRRKRKPKLKKTFSDFHMWLD